jgi:asparagine synthase (glutamine-hydrolysing)
VKTVIAILSKSGENTVPKLIDALEKAKVGNSACFGIATSSKISKPVDLEELNAQELNSSVATGYVSTKTPSDNETYMLKLESATLTFEGRIFSTASKPTKEIIEKNLKTDLAKSAESILKSVEGEFALIINQPEAMLAARDPVGVQPLYFGETTEIAALATNRKALWRLGIEEPKSFPPGHTGIITRTGFQFTPVKVLEVCKPKPTTMAEAADTLQKMLKKAIQKRVADQKEVAVAFSGGLDSSVVAWLAKKSGVGVQLIHVSLENQPETLEARRAAEELDLPLQEHLFSEADVERDITKVVELIEEPEPINVAIGLPFYWNAQKAAAAGLSVMLAGQGADELFGGYQRYVKEYMTKGDEAFRKTMFHDVTTIHESNVERDEKIFGFFDVELRIPFGSYEMADFAMGLPTELKFEKKPDSLRKLVLRKAAENMGIPKDIAEKPKKAVQYGTGTNTMLKKIAKKHNLTLADYVNSLFLEIKQKTEKSRNNKTTKN